MTNYFEKPGCLVPSMSGVEQRGGRLFLFAHFKSLGAELQSCSQLVRRP